MVKQKYHNHPTHKRRRKSTATKYRHLSLKDTFSDCQDLFMEGTPSFFQLLDEHFDIQEFIPTVFTNAFYQRLCRKRLYPLTCFLSVFILQKIFSIPSDSLLILFLSLQEACDFCGFSVISNVVNSIGRNRKTVLTETPRRG